jgi:hypothetical protein
MAWEKYVFALGQSPEGFALMKTDPLQSGSKVSKMESPQKVGTNFLLEFFLSPLTLAEKIKWNQITMKKCDECAHLCGGRHRAAALSENRTWE